MNNLNTLLLKLGISNNNNFYFIFKENKWKNQIPYRLHKGLSEISPEGLLIYENKLIALFLNNYTEIHQPLHETYKNIWNLGGIPVVFIINRTSIDIYNGLSFDTQTSLLDKLKYGNKVATVDNINKHFSVWDILSGKSFEIFNQLKPRVDESLLKNLENTRALLTNTGLHNKYALNLIGRLLFSRYLLDRNIKIECTYFTDKQSFLKLILDKNSLYRYFEYLKQTFNGDLFPVSNAEINQVTDAHLQYLYELFSGSKISNNTIQKSLFDIYDFSIIPVELISEVYERFMGLEKKKSQAAYYTPSFLVDYVLAKTIKPHLKNNNNCKILDPSCGSGIFLVEALRSLIEKALIQNNTISSSELKKIVTDNIYGIDIDENAINLSIFSLCLILLEYVSPKDITKFKFPKLKDKNLFCCDFFDANHEMNQVINNIDFIVGNPPWGSDTKRKSIHKQYFTENNIPISDKQIAQTFFARTKNFSSKKTKCCFVLPSKTFLYNHKANSFRSYMLENFYINEVLELSPVRHKLFVGAVAPTAIISFAYANNSSTGENIVTHTSVKPNVFLIKLNFIVIERNDIKQIKQKYFKEDPSLWKAMLYGNILDYNLLKKIKEYPTIESTVKSNNLKFGQGFIKNGPNNNCSSAHLLGKTLLDTKNGLTKYWINTNSLTVFNDSSLIQRQGIITSPPYVLLKRAFHKKDFSLTATYSETPFCFNNLVFAISGSDTLLLKNICGVLNSSLLTYFLLLQGTSAGVEREEFNKEDLTNFPMINNNKISKCVDKLLSLYAQSNLSLYEKSAIEEEIKKEEETINEIIIKELNLSKKEVALIDYAQEITIPQINNSNTPNKSATKEQLKNYADIFLQHFNNKWSDFYIDIYFNDHVVGINCIINKSDKNNAINFYNDNNIEKIFELLKIGEQKITDTFYEQKDIRGFNRSSFYLVKSNQYKNWHPAMAHADISEFMDAMLSAGKQHLLSKQHKNDK